MKRKSFKDVKNGKQQQVFKLKKFNRQVISVATSGLLLLSSYGVAPLQVLATTDETPQPVKQELNTTAGEIQQIDNPEIKTDAPATTVKTEEKNETSDEDNTNKTENPEIKDTVKTDSEVAEDAKKLKTMGAATKITTGAFTFTTTNNGTYSYENNILKLDGSGGKYTVSMSAGATTTDRIEIAGANAEVTLSNVDIDQSSNDYAAAVSIIGGVPATILLEGTNTLKSGSNCAGLQQLGSTGSITIAGTGKLNATGGSNASGIGGGSKRSATVIIEEGTVTATKGSNGFDIGSGYGSASSSSITITGGSVNATSSTGKFSDTPTDDNGAEVALCDLFSGYAAGQEVLVDGEDFNISAPHADNKLYLYLTKETHTVQVGDSTKQIFWDSNSNIFQLSNSAFIVTSPQGLADVTYENGVLTLGGTGTKEYTVTMANAGAITKDDRIFIDGSHKVTLKDVSIDKSSGGDPAVYIDDNSSATILLEGVNTLKSGANMAGLQQNSTGGSITIAGTGKLEATGGSNSSGIGSSNSSNAKVTIESGTVTGTGGTNSSGIGGGLNSDGVVTIKGGTVTGHGGNGGSGIGSGSNGTGIITIEGGVVTGTGGYGSSGIGGSYYGIGEVTIKGGTVTATKGDNGFDIGSGYSGGSGAVTITGGSVNATSSTDKFSDAPTTGTENGNTNQPVALCDLFSGYVAGQKVLVDGEDFKIFEPHSAADDQLYLYLTKETHTVQVGNTIKRIYWDGTSKFVTSDFNVTSSDDLKDVTYKDGVLTLGGATSKKYTVTMAENIKTTTSDRIEIKGNHTVTLKDVSIDQSSNNDTAAVDIDGNSSATILLEGTNALKSGKNCAGLQQNSTGGSITIAGTGELDATGGSNGSGIGSGEDIQSRITIESGTVRGIGGKYCSGIGSGGDGKGTVTIEGGTVTGEGGEYGSGIGGGWGGHGTVTIKNGTVRGTGGSLGSGIGGGYSGDGTVTIEGGTVRGTGGERASGIGGGNGNRGTVRIEGGTITGEGGERASGIGGGFLGNGTVTIEGGTVTATKGLYAFDIGHGTPGSAAISSSVTITGGSVKTTSATNKFSTAPTTGTENGNTNQLVALCHLFDYVAGKPVSVKGKNFNISAPHSNDNQLYLYLTKEDQIVEIGDTEYNVIWDGSVGDGRFYLVPTVTFSEMDNLTYDGTPKKLIATIKGYSTPEYGAPTITYYKKNSDKALSGAPSDAGEYKATYELTAGTHYAALEEEIEFSIGSRDIEDNAISLGTIEDQKYTGSDIQPDVALTYNKSLLTKDKDYSLTYSNNTALGQASITIKGEGNFTGERTTSFKIVQQSLADAEVKVTGSYEYDGTEQKPAGNQVEVTLNKKTLTAGTDYTLSYQDNINAGEDTAKVIVTGKGNYASSVEGTFTIDKATPKLTDLIYDLTAVTYNGSEQPLSVTPQDKFGAVETTYNGQKKVPTNAGNYSIAFEVAGNENYKSVNLDNVGTYTISPKEVGITAWEVTTKEYDGKTQASVTPVFDNRVVGGDTLSTTATATFNNKNVGTAKEVTISKVDLTGKDKDNYTLATDYQTQASGTITKKSVDVQWDELKKVYDGNNELAVTGKIVTEEIISGDNVTLGTNTGTVASKNIGVQEITLTKDIELTGDDAGNYQVETPSLTGEITAKELSVKKYAVTEKIYDGNTNAAIGAELDGIVEGETVTATVAGTFANKNAGKNKTVAIDSVALAGADIANYTLDSGYSQEATGTITKKAIAVTDWSQPEKVYSASVKTSVNGTLNQADIANSDKVTLADVEAAFTDRNVGTAKAVTIDKKAALTGADADNYQIATDTDFTTTGTITKKTIAVTWGNPIKNYDGQTNTAVAGSVAAAQIIEGDTVLIESASGTFQNKNVGTAIEVTVDKDSIVLGGTGSENYQVDENKLTTTGTITAAGKTAVFKPITKAYDGNKEIELELDLEQSGIKPGDDVKFVSASGTFASKDVGSDISVNIDELKLSGTDAKNYHFTNTTTSGTITQKEITATNWTGSKTYDGTTDVAVKSQLDGLVAGEALSLTGTATFEDANAGDQGFTVTKVAFSDDTVRKNYRLADTSSLTGTGTIKQKAITGKWDTIKKVYDGNNSAKVTGMLDQAAIIASDEVRLEELAGTFEGTDVGDYAISLTESISLTGNQANNYKVTMPEKITGEISKREISVNGYQVTDKTYDGTKTADITASFDNVVSGETIEATTKGSFNDKNVGTDKEVTVASVVLSDTNKNYTLLEPTVLTTQGTITKKEVSVAGFTVADKSYDATTEAAVTAKLTGIVKGEEITSQATGTFEDKNVGKDKAVTVTDVQLSGKASENYTLASLKETKATGTITAKKVSVKAFNVADKTYDGTTDATVTADLSGVIEGDTVSSKIEATFNNKNAGTDKKVTVSSVTLTDNDLGNYTLADSEVVAASGTITAKTLDVTDVTAETKTYDGTTNATVSGKLSGIIDEDDVAVALSGEFSDANAGTDKKVTVTEKNLTGADKDNYQLSDDELTTTAEISPEKITITGWNADKTYDGTNAAEATATFTLGGKNRRASRLSPTFEITASGTFTNKNAGQQEVTLDKDTIKISTDDAGNYEIVETGILVFEATIEKKAIWPQVSVTDKVYDGTKKAPVTGTFSAEDEIAENDEVVLVVSGNFLDKNVGSEKVVMVEISLEGADRNNYEVHQQSVAPLVSITVKPITISGVTAKDRVVNPTTKVTLDGTKAKLNGVETIDADKVSFELGEGQVETVTAEKNKAVTTNISLTGDEAKNYQLTQPTDITVNLTAVASEQENPKAGTDISTGNTSGGNFTPTGKKYTIDNSTPKSLLKTNDSMTNLGILGSAIVGIAGFIGFKRRKKNQE